MPSTLTEAYDSDVTTTLAQDVQKLRTQRRLILLVAKRQLGLRYQRSVIGIWWTLVSPTLETAVLWLVFSHVFRYSSPEAPYIVYLLSGLVMATLLRNSMLAITSTVDANRAILSRVRLPPEVFAVATMLDTFVSSTVLVVPLLIVMLITGPGLQLACLLVFIPLGFLSLFALGVGLILAPVATRFPDVIVIAGVVLTFTSYLAPVFYPAGILSPALRTLEHFNPLYEFIDIFRSMLFGQGIGTPLDYLAMIGFTTVAVVLGTMTLRRTRRFVLEAL